MLVSVVALTEVAAEGDSHLWESQAEERTQMISWRRWFVFQDADRPCRPRRAAVTGRMLLQQMPLAAVSQCLPDLCRLHISWSENLYAETAYFC